MNGCTGNWKSTVSVLAGACVVNNRDLAVGSEA